MRFGLDRMHKLMTALGMPQRRFASIHVVGSNGKSSTVRFIAAILERHGLRTGSYTSPHLGSFRERIEVGEEPVSPERFAAAVERAAGAAAMVERTLDDEDDRVTQFEALTAAAYHELAARGVRGGRDRGRPGRALRRHQRDPVAGPGAHRRGARAHPLARARRSPTSPRRSSTWCATTRRSSRRPSTPRCEAVAERVAAERNARLIRAGDAVEGVRLRAPGGFQRAQLRRRPRGGAGVPGPRARPGRGGARRRRDPHPRPARRGRPGAAHRLRRRPQPRGRPGAGRSAARSCSGTAAPSCSWPAILEDKDAAGDAGGAAARRSTPPCSRAAPTRARCPRPRSDAADQVGGPPAETVADPRERGRARPRAGRAGRRGGGHGLDLPDRRPRARAPARRAHRPSDGGIIGPSWIAVTDPASER